MAGKGMAKRGTPVYLGRDGCSDVRGHRRRRGREQPWSPACVKLMVAHMLALFRRAPRLRRS
jgi:hypothetical protein